jgi:hypothetical protein
MLGVPARMLAAKPAIALARYRQVSITSSMCLFFEEGS